MEEEEGGGGGGEGGGGVKLPDGQGSSLIIRLRELRGMVQMTTVADALLLRGSEPKSTVGYYRL